MALRGGSRGHGLLPGQGDSLRRGRIEAHFAEIAKKRKMRVAQIVGYVADLVVADLEKLTPKDTGAAAGTTEGARRPMYDTHPAKLEGRSIGHELGQSGWQVIKMDKGKKISIVNPMWEPYLKYVNYASGHGNFVETAARNMRENIKQLLAEKV